MNARYLVWIEENVPPDPTRLCREVTLAMAAAFPELRRVRGHYFDPWDDRRGFPHWWLVASNGEIVDPTAAQFPSRGAGIYEPHDETGPEPTGKCLECGAYAYERRIFCSDDHERAFAASLTAAPDGGRGR